MDAILALLLDASNYILVIMLVAMGLVIIFGLMNVINMAHGELFLLGAYTVVTVEGAGGSFWLRDTGRCFWTSRTSAPPTPTAPWRGSPRWWVCTASLSGSPPPERPCTAASGCG